MILEFISTAVETQPGLVDLFLDLSSKEDQVSFLVMFYEKQTNNQIIKTYRRNACSSMFIQVSIVFGYATVDKSD